MSVRVIERLRGAVLSDRREDYSLIGLKNLRSFNSLFAIAELTESNTPPEDLRPDDSMFGGALDVEPHKPGNEEAEQKINFTSSLLKTSCGGAITVWVGRVRLGGYDSTFLKPDNPM